MRLKSWPAPLRLHEETAEIEQAHPRPVVFGSQDLLAQRQTALHELSRTRVVTGLVAEPREKQEAREQVRTIGPLLVLRDLERPLHDPSCFPIVAFDLVKEPDRAQAGCNRGVLRAEHPLTNLDLAFQEGSQPLERQGPLRQDGKGGILTGGLGTQRLLVDREDALHERQRLFTPAGQGQSERAHRKCLGNPNVIRPHRLLVRVDRLLVQRTRRIGIGGKGQARERH